MMDRQLAAFYNMHYQQAVNSLKIQSGHIAGMEQTRSLSGHRFGLNNLAYADIGNRNATNSNKGFYLCINSNLSGLFNRY